MISLSLVDTHRLEVVSLDYRSAILVEETGRIGITMYDAAKNEANPADMCNERLWRAFQRKQSSKMACMAMTVLSRECVRSPIGNV